MWSQLNLPLEIEEQPPVTAEEAIAALAVLDAARVSAVKGRTVAIEETALKALPMEI